MKQIAICKVDKNQREIVMALRKVGASVIHLHTVGNGCPDLLVGFRGENFLIEVKLGKGKLTPAQKTLHTTWQGLKIGVARTVEEALSFIGAIKTPDISQ